jgi:hypothetical protein
LISLLYYSCFTSESHGSWSSYFIEINLSLMVESGYLLNIYSVIWIVQHCFIFPWLSCKVSNCLSMSISSPFTQFLPSLSYEVLNGLFRNLSVILRCSTIGARCLINTTF